LPDLLGEEILKGGKERYYRVTDKFLAHKDEIESHLRKAQAQHFDLNRTLFLYDLTNTHFEGECKANPKAKRGKSKQKRNDCPLVVVGMVFDEFGFELAHQTFEGNKNDSKSLIEMIESLRRIVDDDDTLFSTVKPIVIVDAGVATKKNLRLLRKEGYSYLVNDSRRKRSAHREQFNKKEGFRTVGGRFKNGQERPPVKVKVIESTVKETETCQEPQPDGTVKIVKKEQCFTEHLILCRSDARRNKELAIISNAEKRYLEGLQALADRVEKGTLKDPVKIQQAIGRVGASNPRAKRFYTVNVAEKKIPAGSEKGSRKKGKSPSVKREIKWERDDKRLHENDDLPGCYVLRTDCLDLTDEEYWHLYTTLTYAEDGFHALKGDLGLRPNHHRIERRVDAHVFISVLAYHILHHILYALKLAGDDRCWFTIRQILQTHAYTTIMMPTADGKLYRLRKAGQPEECQQEIYRRIGINACGLPATKNVVPYETTL
jgi:transposase